MYRITILSVILMLLSIEGVQAAMQEQTITTELDGVQMQGAIVFDEALGAQQPAILMIPNWMGVTENAMAKAKKIAAHGYVVYVADMYGVHVRPKNPGEAGKAAGAVRADIALMRKRMNHHLELLRAYKKAPTHEKHIAAIGFCFGGGCVLELSRSGAELAAVVSFHGNLNTPNAADAAQIKAKVLVLHGAVDPVVPPEQVAAFQKEMDEAQVDYQLVAFGGAVHSFTNPDAAAPGRSQYDERTARRSFKMMFNLFDELFTE